MSRVEEHSGMQREGSEVTHNDESLNMPSTFRKDPPKGLYGKGRGELVVAMVE